MTKIENVDYRSIVIKKMGLENFLNLADVVDTYKNYPENDWWAKSEYKLVNMKNMIAKIVEKEANGKLRQIYYYDYAPFLYMKNQTTGVYHLEGIHPSCKTLYDALKMRYNGLDIKNYDIRDIK